MIEVRAALPIILAGMALVLSGCGGGGNGPTPAPKANCLCVFDVDRTLTGQQQVGHSPPCTKNEVMPHINDTAYDWGPLSLSVVGQSLKGTFCSECYVGIVSAGDAGAQGSAERSELVKRLGSSGGNLPSTEWSGPSKIKEARRNCTVNDASSSTLVLGCNDGTKQHAVKGIVAWLSRYRKVDILPKNVWMFDDRENNIAPFRGTGFNARQISCETRDAKKQDLIGLCGAT